MAAVGDKQTEIQFTYYFVTGVFVRSMLIREFFILKGIAVDDGSIQRHVRATKLSWILSVFSELSPLIAIQALALNPTHGSSNDLIDVTECFLSTFSFLQINDSRK